MRSSDINQIILVISGFIVMALFGVFLYREIYPEYKIYQDDYIDLEAFRSTYTHQSPTAFVTGVKQIVLEREDRGPPVIDRCASCHVALQIPYFSKTKISYDINGNMVLDQEGKPILIPNEDYIWGKLDEKIKELTDEKANEQLKNQGKERTVKERLKEAEKYRSLKIARVGEIEYNVEKALTMHPLIGKETRPFEFHPVEEYGCVSCHNGNGRGLTTDKAHGPVFDDHYEKEFTGTAPIFTEPDPDNDPSFARVFNSKPGHSLLFQTQPLFVGALIQAKCMQCHQTSEAQLEQAAFSATQLTDKKQRESKALQEAFQEDKNAVVSLLRIKKKVEELGVKGTLGYLRESQKDYRKPVQELNQIKGNIQFLEQANQNRQDEEKIKQAVLQQINQQLALLIGSPELIQSLETLYDKQGQTAIDEFLSSHREDAGAKGTLFIKQEALNYNQALMRHIQETKMSFQSAAQDEETISALNMDIDELTRNYKRGKELYLSQACYACHRIAGFARGGVGPELTRIGESYPWYIKESIVWPQADLKNSTMPNMHIDHEELEDLMTFLLAQKGSNRSVSQTSYQSALQSWEAGRKVEWEKPIPPAKIHDLRDSMTTYAMQGCASCHRLQGFESNVGFKIEKKSHEFNDLHQERQWFKKLFPEVERLSFYDLPLPGSEIVSQIEKHSQEIDERIVSDVRQDSILEEIEKKHPGTIEGLYAEFKYASRAKNHYFEDLLNQAKDQEAIKAIEQERKAWQDRVHRVLMMYIQEYGLGRLIGPHPNWSGVYRTDEWLMEHFRNPTQHVPRSIMPAFPFDDSKFYALTYMLDRLGIRNRNETRAIWNNQGFNPAEAYNIHCSQCHGLNLEGNGAISEWLYPLPKNLRQSDFMRNLTKDRVVYSITHGVKGTPMPPWGEIGQDKSSDIQESVHNQPVLTKSEIDHLADWLFSNLPGGTVIRQPGDILKWQYQPKDVLEELQKEGGQLYPLSVHQIEEMKEKELLPEKNLPEENNPPVEPEVGHMFPTGEGYYASIRPEIYHKQVPSGVQQVDQVEEVFDRIPDQTEPDRYRYYIKKKYYTPYNLQEGQKFFLLNCAVCHGNEADGSGIRSQAMQDAKPRMLTNLDWIGSRDDLRLLRSIKYGVLGTSMTPWGDYTNSLQRMQLTMFIRALSQKQALRRALDQSLYDVFDKAQSTVDQARFKLSQTLLNDQEKEKQSLDRQSTIETKVEEGKSSSKLALENYQALIKIKRQINSLEEQDNQLIELKSEIKREKELRLNLGIDLINKDLKDDVFEEYFEMIRSNENRYRFQGDQLEIKESSRTIQSIKEWQETLIRRLDEKITTLKLDLAAIELRGSENKEAIKAIEADIGSYQKLRIKAISDSEEALRSMDRQKRLVQSFNQEISQRKARLSNEKEATPVEAESSKRQ